VFICTGLYQLIVAAQQADQHWEKYVLRCRRVSLKIQVAKCLKLQKLNCVDFFIKSHLIGSHSLLRPGGSSTLRVLASYLRIKTHHSVYYVGEFVQYIIRYITLSCYITLVLHWSYIICGLCIFVHHRCWVCTVFRICTLYYGVSDIMFIHKLFLCSRLLFVVLLLLSHDSSSF